MHVSYKNKKLERVLFGVNTFASALVVTSFVLLFGFDRPLLPSIFLHSMQFFLLIVFVSAKFLRFYNSVSKAQFLRAFWFDIPLLLILLFFVIGAGRLFALETGKAAYTRTFAVGIYLVLQVFIKLCRTSVDLAASGKKPAPTLIASFVALIFSGAGILMLPASATNGQGISFIDALFTSTSATCVTGLTVKSIGDDFSMMGQIVILALIQLGGLGIVIFGAVMALLLGQAFTVRESVAMQDLLSANTLSKIGDIIAFIFIGTISIEAFGAIGLYGMWDNVPGIAETQNLWFYSIFHSISAFCNAGISLFHDSFVNYNRCWQIYLVICPMIILGGLGFTVLLDLFNIAADRLKRLFKKVTSKQHRFSMEAPRKMLLQTKVVITASAALIVFGALAILGFEKYASINGAENKINILDVLFQSITARTAGFNTVSIDSLTPSSKLILIFLMFIGGSPGSTAGGIKTVTFVVILMAAITVLRKRAEVEMFNRSIRTIVVGRAFAVTVLFAAVFFVMVLALSITEKKNGFSMLSIMFEGASALGTVGLSTGITGALTIPGKLIIIIMMLIGRLGPLTLLAALTFNLKPARYSYPEESLMVG